MIKAGDTVWTVELQNHYMGRVECPKCYEGYFTVKTKDNMYMEIECPSCYGIGSQSWSIPVLGLCAYRIIYVNEGKGTCAVKKLHIMKDGSLCDDLMPHIPIKQSETFKTKEAAQAWLSELEKGISK